MKQRYAIPALMFLVGIPAFAAEPGTSGADSAYLSFVPFIREHPCDAEAYRQIAASLPLQGASDGREGHAWRLMYGFCVAQKGRIRLHQDLVVSYLDVRPIAGAPGGDGISLGTDFSVRWRPERHASLTPFYEFGLGIQYAALTPFPAHGSRWTFTINAGAGILIPVTPAKQVSTALRYLHMSNAGWFPKNAGYDAFHLVVGLRWGG